MGAARLREHNHTARLVRSHLDAGFAAVQLGGRVRHDGQGERADRVGWPCVLRATGHVQVHVSHTGRELPVRRSNVHAQVWQLDLRRVGSEHHKQGRPWPK